MGKLKGKIGFVGGGMMGEALCRGLIKAGVCEPGQIRISDPDEQRCILMAQVIGEENVFNDNIRLCKEVDTVVLAVKPQIALFVLEGLKGEITEHQLVVSIITALTLQQLTSSLDTDRVVRVMPNTPVLVGAGASGYSAGEGVTPDDRETVRTILNSVGIAFELPEKHLAAVTGLSGSGPAFIYLLIEAMADAGVYLGLPRTVSQELAAQTFKGAAQMVLETGAHPGMLKDRVTTPGGTTIDGLLALGRNGGCSALMDAVIAAGEKALRLSSK